MSKSVRVEILKGHCLGGGRGDVFAGQVLEVPGDLTRNEAEAKIARGQAIAVGADGDPIEAPEEKTEAGEDGGEEEDEERRGGVETRDPKPEHRDPPIRRETKPKRKRPRSRR